MKLCTFSFDREPLKPGVKDDDEIIDLSSLDYKLSTPDSPNSTHYGPSNWVAKFYSPEGINKIENILTSSDAGKESSYPRIPIDDIRLGPPVPRPGKIVAAGRNYKDHMDEAMIIWEERGKEVELPTDPTGFLKVPSAVAGPEDEIKHPAPTEEMDYEVELAVVMGQYAYDVKEDEALDYVAGYTVMNDLNTRDIQFAEMDQVGIVLGKNFEGLAPMGPYVVTKDELGDPQDIQIKCWVDGDLRQDASTSGMVFPVAELVSHFSQMGLYPGDVLMTGSPPGIAAAKRPDPDPYYLKPGSVVETEAEGIGKMENDIIN